MDSKKISMLSLVISLALSCTLIPVGLIKGWGFIEYAIGIASIIISGLIIFWNNEPAFHKITDTNFRIGYYFIGLFCFCFGVQGIWGSWGNALLYKGIGAAVMITGAILSRLAFRTKGDTTE